MSPLARFAALVATTVAVCFAAVQLSGRALFAQLPHFEGALNSLLAERGIQVEGLRGRWHGLNPGVFIERLWFPAGEASGFDFELDLLESLGRNRVVARRMTVADGHLTLARTAAGWRLEGQRADGELDVRTFFLHSDQVWLRGRLMFRDGPKTAGLQVDTMWINQNARHRFHVHLQPDTRCDDCALLVEGDVAAGSGPGAVNVAARHFNLGSELNALLLSRLPASSPFSKAHFELALNADWRRDLDGSERARARLDLTALGLPAAPAKIGATLSALRLEEGGYRGRMDAAALTSGDAAVDLTGGGFSLRGLDSEPALDLWLGQLAAEDFLALALAAIGVEHRTGRWLANVAPRGDIHGLTARFDGDGLAFRMQGANAAVDDYRGMPKVDRMDFAVGGHGRAFRLDFEGRDFEFAFPEYFAAQGPHEHGGGSILFTFSPGFMGLRSPRIWGLTQGSRADVGFALARPEDRDEVRVAVDGKVDGMATDHAAGYLPKALPPEVRAWLHEAVQGGELSDIRVLYRGHARRRGDLPIRRVELAAHVANGSVDYHADWPAASAIDGLLEVTGEETRLRGTARAFDLALSEVELRLPRGAGRAHVKLRGGATAGQLVDFVWATPVHEAMPFFSNAWAASGDVEFAAALNVPFQGEPVSAGDVQLDLRLQDADFDLADLDLRFDAMNGDVRFVFPAELSSEALHGRLFGEPVDLAIASDEEAVRFSFAGTARVEDAYRLLDIENLRLAHGSADFDATLSMFPASDRALELHVASDLKGVEVSLPAPLDKAPADLRQLTVSLQFLDPHVAVSATYGDASGWLHVGDAGILAGAVGIGVPVPMADAERGRVVFGGGVAAIDAAVVANLIDYADAGDQAPFAWELRRFRVDALGLETVTFPDVVLDASSDPDATRFVFESPNLAGSVAQSGDQPWQVQLQRLALPALDSEDDPLGPDVMDRLVPADVVLDAVTVGEKSYGSWRFGLALSADGVLLSDVVGDIRGLHIESASDVFWSRSGETHFKGSVAAGDLEEVLPQWDFAPSVESESFTASGDLRWPGSPLNFDLHHLSGHAELAVDNGRFLDIAPGGTRIMSLINFSTIVKRMSFDFSDVFGEGVSFDRVSAKLAVTDGLASFTQPAEIVGTGGNFLVGGTVNLDSGSLDNEMVVTLPFLRSNLPWYAAFLAFSNPASAAGVWIGQQVLKNQISRLSSGKYHIGGTYDEPTVEFVGIFDNNVDIVAGPPGTAEGQEVVQ